MFDKTFNIINKSSKKEVFLSLFTFAVAVQVVGIIAIKVFFSSEVVIFDPRFEASAYNLINKGTLTIEFDNGKEYHPSMQNAYDLQKGRYTNWYPFGYSVFLAFPMLFGENYWLVRTILQLIIFAFIPCLLFSLILKVFSEYKFIKVIGFVFSLLFCIYPYYMISSLWTTDTWMTFIINLYCFNMLFSKGRYRDLYLMSGLTVLFFFRPLALLPFFIVLIYLFYKRLISPISLLKITLVVFSVLLLWGYRNYSASGYFKLTQSNMGYNLYLGNNQYTYEVLKKRWGDGSTIEDDIFPLVDSSLSYMQYLNEYQKDSIFNKMAFSFISEQKLVILKSTILKIFGFWSPIRMRQGHWSESSSKSIIIGIYGGTLVLLFIVWVMRSMFKKIRLGLFSISSLLFILFWMLPYLVFFTTYRYRTPIDFLIYILGVSIFFKSFNNYLSKRLC